MTDAVKLGPHSVLAPRTLAQRLPAGSRHGADAPPLEEAPE